MRELLKNETCPSTEFEILQQQEKCIFQDLMLYRVPTDLEELLKILVAVLLTTKNYLTLNQLNISATDNCQSLKLSKTGKISSSDLISGN